MKSQGKGSRGNDFAINYLKFAVKDCNNEDLAIHNFLLALVCFLHSRMQHLPAPRTGLSHLFCCLTS